MSTASTIGKAFGRTRKAWVSGIVTVLMYLVSQMGWADAMTEDVRESLKLFVEGLIGLIVAGAAFAATYATKNEPTKKK